MIASTSGNTPPVCKSVPVLGAATGQTYTVHNVAADDVDGDAVTYAWTLESIPTASNATLSSGTASAPSLNLDAEGDYFLSITLNDGQDDSRPCNITINSSSTANTIPVAVAGQGYGVFTGRQFSIDGSSSFDADGDLITYTWSVISSPGDGIMSISAADQPRAYFTASADGYYVIRLTVRDGTASGKPLLIPVHASPTGDVPQDIQTGFSSICTVP